MLCTSCKKREAIVELPYLNAQLCEGCFCDKLEKRFRKTLHRMIKRRDKMLVAISGGKDSLTMLYLLKKNVRCEKLEALLIDEGIKGYRDKAIICAKKMCRQLDVKLHIVSFKKEYGKTIDQMAKMKRKLGICSYCGVLRRALLNKAARELGFDKLAIGHNLDDEAQSSLMNIIRGEYGRVARSGPEVGVIRDERFVPRIKPLRELSEREIMLYVYLKKIPKDFSQCPYAGEAYRNDVRQWLNAMETKYPGTKRSILHSNDKLAAMLRKEVKGAPMHCKRCGELCAERVCKACEHLKELGLK